MSRYRSLVVLAVLSLVTYTLLPADRLSLSFTSLRQWADDLNPFGCNPELVPLEIEEWNPSTWNNPDVTPKKKVYKSDQTSVTPIPDPFPLLSQNPPPRPSLLRAPKVNTPKRRHYREQTPLFVGFTRNWPQLLQCVVSYIAAGWPPEDIFVVENTGVVYSNRDGKLSLQNPFYLNYTQLGMLGVNIIMVWIASLRLLESYPLMTGSHLDADPLDVLPTPELLPLVSNPFPLLL
jgi:hypothetical protein